MRNADPPEVEHTLGVAPAWLFSPPGWIPLGVATA